MDAQELKEHLRQTPSIIQQIRARMNPNDYQYSDEDTGGQFTFGPKSPTNDYYIDLADYEASLVGNLARYCMTAGSIPTAPLRGFWFITGTCMGMNTYGLSGVRTVCNHLSDHADWVTQTEGVGELIVEMAAVRTASLALFPNENEDWLTMEEAMEFTGKSERRIYEWLSAGGIRTLDDRWGLMISRSDLQTKMAIIYASRLAVLKKAREFNSKNVNSQADL